jgi:hypothetical protein
MFGFIRRLICKSGCLDNKTSEMIHFYFKGLVSFVKDDPGFFQEQYLDLQPREKKKFHNWVVEQTYNKSISLSIMNKIDQLIKIKK